MTTDQSYQDTELYKQLSSGMPAIKRMEQLLREVEPSLISTIIEAEPETVFILDYYFRLFDTSVGARIVSDPNVSVHVLVELFNCQIVRFYRVNLDESGYNAAYSSLRESYWRDISRERLLELFRTLIATGEGNRLSAVVILQNMDLQDLKMLRKEQSQSLLEFFKSFQDFESVIKDNLNLYDYIYKLALEAGDDDFLRFLDEFTTFIVRLRIAQSFIMEAEDYLGPDGKIPFKQVVEMVRTIPSESLDITLQMLHRQGYVEETTITGLKEHLGLG